MITSRVARIRDLQRAGSEIVAWLGVGRAVEIVGPGGRVVGVALPIEAVKGVDLGRDEGGWRMPAERSVVLRQGKRELTGADLASVGVAIWRRGWLLPMAEAVGVSPSAARALWKGKVLPRRVARRLKALAEKHGIEIRRG